MVQAINFAVRDSAGGKQFGSVAGDDQGNFIQVGSGESISLNLAKESIVAYQQQGSDLVVQLSDGRAIVLSNYFNDAAGLTNHLYISSEGEMTEVLVQQSTDGALFADYGPVSGWDKWSPLDDLRFTTADNVSDAAYVANEPAGMAPFVPLLAGLSGGGAAAAAVGAAALVAAGASSGGSSSTSTDTTTTGTTTGTTTTTDTTTGTGTTTGTTTTTPADTTAPSVLINEGTKSVSHVETGAEYANGVQIGGTSEAGATITVEVNGKTQTTTVGSNGTWEVTFPQSDIAGGQYTTPVKVTATDASGNSTTATDTLVLDTVVDPFTHTSTNTSSVKADSVLNAAEAASGLTVGGAVEAGSTVMVKLGDGSYHAATVTGTTWTYTFPAGEITAGDLHNMTMTAVATDGYGNVSSPISSVVQVDTLVSNFTQNAINTSAVKADTVLNAAEAASGLTVSGTVEAGSTVVVSLGGVSHNATVTGTTWSYTFAASEVSAGDLHSMAVTAVATDAYGNVSSTINSSVDVDTLVSNFTQNAFNTSAVKADSVLNAAEAASGLTVSGTVEAGSTVVVSLGGVSYNATVTGTTWSYTFAASEITSGDLHSMAVKAVATDAYGNTSTLNSSLAVDTLVSNFAHTSSNTSGVVVDNILNKAEAASGLTVGGTVEAGSSVMVKLDDGSYHAATVSGTTWTYTFAPTEISAGNTHNVTLTAIATDGYGNVSSPITSAIVVDTDVINFEKPTALLAGDGILNAAEAAAGLVVSGTAEAYSKIVVHMANGSELLTTSDASGNWSVTFSTAQLPSGASGSSSVTVTATDTAGNSESYNQSFTYDTVAPDSPWVDQ